jgi:hypothetical protein
MAQDYGKASERLGIDVGTTMIESGKNRTNFRIDKWDLDQIHWARGQNMRWLIFDPREEPNARWFKKFNCTPAEVVEDHDCNLITAAGWTRCLGTGGWQGSATTAFSSTVGRVGLGQVAAGTSPSYTDTALGAATGWTGGNWQLNGAAATYTAATAGVPATMVFTCTFGTGAYSSNAITEFAVDQGTSASSANTTASVAPMVNHGIIASGSYGTKTSAQTWNTTVTMTFT